MKKALITGITGQDGAYLADYTANADAFVDPVEIRVKLGSDAG